MLFYTLDSPLSGPCFRRLLDPWIVQLLPNYDILLGDHSSRATQPSKFGQSLFISPILHLSSEFPLSVLRSRSDPFSISLTRIINAIWDQDGSCLLDARFRCDVLQAVPIEEECDSLSHPRPSHTWLARGPASQDLHLEGLRSMDLVNCHHNPSRKFQARIPYLSCRRRRLDKLDPD